MNNSYPEKGMLLRSYKVSYISGIASFPKIQRGLLMQLYTEGIVFSGKSFPFIWIPYHCVFSFVLVVGYGSRLDYRPSDMGSAKVIELTYRNSNNQKGMLKFELAPTINVFKDHRTRMELIPFMKANGIFDKFMKVSPLSQEPQADIYSQIEKLAELHHAGILTDEEFTAKKAELLKRI